MVRGGKSAGMMRGLVDGLTSRRGEGGALWKLGEAIVGVHACMYACMHACMHA